MQSTDEFSWHHIDWCTEENSGSGNQEDLTHIFQYIWPCFTIWLWNPRSWRRDSYLLTLCVSCVGVRCQRLQLKVEIPWGLARSKPAFACGGRFLGLQESWFWTNCELNSGCSSVSGPMGLCFWCQICNFEPQKNLVLSRFISEKPFSMHQTHKEFLQTVSTYQPVTLSTRSTRHKGIQMIQVFMQANLRRIEEHPAERWKLELITGTASIFSHRWVDAELSFFFLVIPWNCKNKMAKDSNDGPHHDGNRSNDRMSFSDGFCLVFLGLQPGFWRMGSSGCSGRAGLTGSLLNSLG